MRYRPIAVGLAVLAVVLGAWRPAPAQVLINGAGATFPYPLYSKWFDVYTKVNSAVRFNYQSIGSGGGIKQLLNRTVDFGASDAPMNDAQLAKAPEPILHFPTVLGAVVITYNVPGLSNALKLTGPVVADVYLGKITKWNAPEIANLNPGVTLPDQPIVVCHRSDGSGTSYIFTDYLSKVSEDWKRDPGKATSVKWPTGLGGKGNEGVTALVQQTPGSIGYVELIYAINNKLPIATLRNHDGDWVQASLASVTAAAAADASQIPADFRVSITDAAGKDSYPLSSFTYLLVYVHQTDATKGKALDGFLSWMLTDGQQYAPALSYAPLPSALLGRENAQIGKIILPGG
ncbi:MAG: phosphate ABC transporter substrate-binding protein PstS [Candidatus Binataceae bacterium]